MVDNKEEIVFKKDCTHLENIDKKHFIFKEYKICRRCGVLLKNDKVNF
jgi:hypothetical protein